jgi:hypothetical protein
MPPSVLLLSRLLEVLACVLTCGLALLLAVSPL